MLFSRSSRFYVSLLHLSLSLAYPHQPFLARATRKGCRKSRGKVTKRIQNSGLSPSMQAPENPPRRCGSNPESRDLPERNSGRHGPWMPALGLDFVQLVPLSQVFLGVSAAVVVRSIHLSGKKRRFLAAAHFWCRDVQLRPIAVVETECRSASSAS